MKKLKTVVLTLLVIVAALSAGLFSACGGGGEGAALSGSMKIVMAPANGDATEVEVDLKGFTDKNTVMDVIEKLVTEQKMCYIGSNGVYGVMLTALGVPVESTYEGQTSLVDNYILYPQGSEFITVLTSVEKDQLEVEPGSSWQPMQKEYEGVTVISSMLGVSSMSICDGAVIYFTIDVYVAP